MVNSIRGILTFKSPDQFGVETGGVEWAIDTSATTLSALPSRGSEVKVYTYLHHTQDQMKMYGFLRPDERKMFLALLSVSGIGPALARKILSGISAERLMAALDTEDVATLSSVPGLGGKTAQKIILHLRGKLTDDSERSDAVGEDIRDVVEALTSMGFESKATVKTVRAILDDPAISSVANENREREILRRAIVELSS